MSTPSSHPDDAALEAARRCLELYGADPGNWPAESRMAYGDVAENPALADVRAEAEALDTVLAEARAPKAGEALSHRLIDSFDSVLNRRRANGVSDVVAVLFTFGKFAPVGAAAGLVAFGAALGVMTSTVTSVSIASPAASEYVEEAFVIAFAEDEEEALWAEE